MKYYIKNLLTYLFRVAIFFSTKEYRLRNRTTSSKIVDYLYSLWISVRFSFSNCFFRKPINTILGAQYFKIGENNSFGRLVVLTAWDNYKGKLHSPKVEIGSNCNFGDYLHLTCINRIVIGNNVLTGRWVTITDNSHGKTDFDSLNIPPANRDLQSKGSVIIEDNVWIGDKVTILPGTTIGTGSIIAANSVVTKDIPSFCVAAGNPAKIIKK